MSSKVSVSPTSLIDQIVVRIFFLFFSNYSNSKHEFFHFFLCRFQVMLFLICQTWLTRLSSSAVASVRYHPLPLSVVLNSAETDMCNLVSFRIVMLSLQWELGSLVTPSQISIGSKVLISGWDLFGLLLPYLTCVLLSAESIFDLLVWIIPSYVNHNSQINWYQEDNSL